MPKRPGAPRPRSKKMKATPKARPAAPGPRGPSLLLYKVVELSTVDETALERTVNEWVKKGWNLDGVQFAMRESSKRPSMAFVFFTRQGEASAQAEPEPEPDRPSDRPRRLAPLQVLPPAPPAPEPAVEPYRELDPADLEARTWEVGGARADDAWERLQRLALDDGEGEGGDEG